jgi:hypothetical protein
LTSPNGSTVIVKSMTKNLRSVKTLRQASSSQATRMTSLEG